MKKFFLFIGLSIFSFGAFAEGVPSVVVNKSQGGWTAIFNMYNYVSYTPADISASGIAQLDCQGSGFSWCRVPNCNTMPINNGTSRQEVADAAKVEMFTNAINSILEDIENAENTDVAAAEMPARTMFAAQTPSLTRKISVRNGNVRGRTSYDNYVVKAVKRTNLGSGETIEIYIDKVNLF